MDKLIPVVVIKELSETERILSALKKSGINCAEITFRTACAADAIRLACEKFPEMKEKLACLDVWTPATYKRYVGSEIGSWMSFALPPKTAPKRISNEIKGLRNVVLATQWLQSPGGLPIAAASGINAVKAVVRRDRKRRAAAEA